MVEMQFKGAFGSTSLDLESLKNYKKQNPAKFKDKFGVIDLDNLPEGFSIEAQKRYILSLKPKTPLLTDEEIRLPRIGGAIVEQTPEEPKEDEVLITNKEL